MKLDTSINQSIHGRVKHLLIYHLLFVNNLLLNEELLHLQIFTIAINDLPGPELCPKNAWAEPTGAGGA